MGPEAKGLAGALSQFFKQQNYLQVGTLRVTFEDSDSDSFVWHHETLREDLTNLLSALQEVLDGLPKDVSTPETSIKVEVKKEFPEPELPELDANIVQVRASKKEIERRINSFIMRKQLEVNEENNREFLSDTLMSKSEESCARTDAVFIPRAGSRSHVRVTRVVNQYGPQTRRPPASESHPTSAPSRERSGNQSGNVSLDGISERLRSMESHLSLGTNERKDVFERIRALEDRILYLESLSPEYFDQSHMNSRKRKHSSGPGQRKMEPKLSNMSVSEIDERISKLKQSLCVKVKTEPMDTFT